MGSNHTKAQNNGYRVIKIAPRSPAKKSGLVEFVDFIIGIDDFANETVLTGNYEAFHDIIQKHENQIITLTVYNILTRSTRKVPIIPHKTWEKADSLLGSLVRYEDYSNAHERVLKVISVNPNSPAASIGLEPEYDYILGTSNQLHFISPTDSIGLEQIGPMEIFIYNAKKKRVWSASITPLSNWEMGGYLGCTFAPEDSSSLPYEPEPEANRKDGSASKRRESGTRFKNEQLVKKLVENSNPEQNGPTEDIQANLAVKPPTDTEIWRKKSLQDSYSQNNAVRDQRSCSFDVSAELTDKRWKLLHSYNPRKGSFMLVSQPFNEYGASSLGHLHEARTLGNLDEPYTLSPAKERYSQEFKDVEKQNTRLTQTSLQTEDQSLAENDSKVNQQQLPHSLLSVSSDVNKDSTADHEKKQEINSDVPQYSYFSKKLGGEYIIRSTDLFNLGEVCIN